MLVNPKGLAYDPADSIAFDRVSGNTNRHGETDSRPLGARGGRNGKKRVSEPPAPSISSVEVRLTPQAPLRG